MSAEAVLEVTLKAEENIGKVFKEGAVQTRELESSIKGLSLTDLKSGLDLAAGAFSAVQGAVKSIIDPVVDAAKEVRDLSAFTGASAEESSKLINVAGDLQIEYGTLRTAARKLTEDGLQPNIKTLSELSDKYLSIEGPIERAQFLTETFGTRAGPELARMMALGSDAIANMAQEAVDMGTVMDEQGVASALRYEQAMDDFNDSILGVKIAIAEGLLPVISAGIEQGAEYVQLWKNVTGAVADGRMGLGEWIATSAEVIWTDKTMAEVNDELAQSYHDQQAALTEVDPAVQNLRLANETASAVTVEYSNQIQSQTQWLDDLAAVYVNNTTPATYGYLTAADLLKEGLSGLTEQMIFNKAAAGLSEEAALQLGIAMGLVDTRVLALNELLPVLKAKYDANHNGQIDAAESAAGYAAAVERLTAAIQSVPANTTATVTTNFVQNGNPYGGPAGPPQQPIPQASGGDWMVTRPTLFLAGEAGPERATFTPLGGGGGGGGVNLTVIFQSMLSLGDRVEMETRVAPLLRELLNL